MAAAVLVAAPASGQGKTTVACALARLHARAGARVRAFKCGPDFIDPQWLALASGGAVDSLDLWINGEADCAARLARAAADADLVVVEGVMGLHDGQPSAADLARRFGLPVLAVVDAHSMAETFGAVAHGLRSWKPGLRWAGVLANRVAGARHAAMLAAALPPGEWQGHLPPDAALALPERHLGLAGAAELPDALARLDAAADALAATPLGARALVDWPCWAPPAAQTARTAQAAGTSRTAGTSQSKPSEPSEPSAQSAQSAQSEQSEQSAQSAQSAQAPQSPQSSQSQSQSQSQAPSPPVAALPAPPLARRRIAVAHDAAFAFIYPANVDTLRALGADLVFFSPLAGHALPDCDAVWLPGGYPELHAAALAACGDLAAQLAAHLAADRPLWAECGGMMALADAIVDGTGREHRMWGLLPGRAVLGRRPAALGPQRLAFGGGELRGHSFHWSTFETPLPAALHTEPAHALPGVAARPGEPVFERGALKASWFHPWFASAPALAARLFAPGALT